MARAQAYRVARRAFIAACDQAHVDAIARLNPAKSADGKPLFMDTAALGPRLGDRGVLALARDSAGSAIQTQLLRARIALPGKARLVLVHAYDPAFFAGAEASPDWPVAMLGAVVSEDLSRVLSLAVLPLAMPGDNLLPLLAAWLPKAAVTLLPSMTDGRAAEAAIRNFLAQ